MIAHISSEAPQPAAAKTAHRKTQPWFPKWDREVHTWPYLMRIEFLAAILVTVLLMAWSLTLNAPLEEPSNPNVTMNPAKAPGNPGVAGNAGRISIRGWPAWCFPR